MTRTQKAFNDNLKSLTTTKKKIASTKKKEKRELHLQRLKMVLNL